MPGLANTSFRDAVDAHAMLDAIEAAEERARKMAEEDAKARRRA